MGRPRQVTDEQILAQARQCFLEHGPSVSTSAIAEQVGVSHAVLFQRFRTKEELFKAALMPAEPGWIKRLAAAPQPHDLKGQLREISLEISAFFEEMVPRFSLMRASGLAHEHFCPKGETPLPIRGHRAVARWFGRASQKKLIRQCDADHVAYVLLGALQAHAFFRHLSGERISRRKREAYVDTVVDLIWRSLS